MLDPAALVLSGSGRPSIRRTSTKNSGTNSTPSTVAETVPPSTVAPMVLRPFAPAPADRTSGSTPSEKATEVIMIGRNRWRAASVTAS